MAILEVQNIIKRFGSHDVLRDISFSLEPGKILAIIGSSGSGKTTLLRCLNFLERPTGGRISVRGDVVFDSNDSKTYDERSIAQKRLHFGLVFQSFHLFPQYTALKNITLAPELMLNRKNCTAKEKKGRLEQIQKEALTLLEQVGLSPKRDFYPHQLSGGQQQRVAIARALALKPDILCFDEPTSALDPEITGEVLSVIRTLAEQKITMLIVTHEIGFAREVSDRIIYMDEGKIVEEGTPQEVLENPKTDRLKAFLKAIL